MTRYHGCWHYGTPAALLLVCWTVGDVVGDCLRHGALRDNGYELETLATAQRYSNIIVGGQQPRMFHAPLFCVTSSRRRFAGIEWRCRRIPVIRVVTPAMPLISTVVVVTPWRAVNGYVCHRPVCHHGEARLLRYCLKSILFAMATRNIDTLLLVNVVVSHMLPSVAWRRIIYRDNSHHCHTIGEARATLPIVGIVIVIIVAHCWF